MIDVILESNNYDRMPRLLLAWYRWRERRWVRRADAVVTVNQPIADHLAAAWHLADAADRAPELPAALVAAGAATGPHSRSRRASRPSARSCSFWVASAESAVSRRPPRRCSSSRTLRWCCWGLGRGRIACANATAIRGSSATTSPCPPVHPDDVPLWTASADVSVIAVPANSLNQRLSTPNKFWESLTAGTPVVVGRDLEVMRGIVEADRLGAIADPADPADLARGLREVLEQGPDSLAAMRARCLAVTRDRYNWETAVQPYLDLVARLLD